MNYLRSQVPDQNFKVVDPKLNLIYNQKTQFNHKIMKNGLKPFADYNVRKSKLNNVKLPHC